MRLVTFQIKQTGAIGAGYVTESDNVVVCAEGAGAEVALVSLIEKDGANAWLSEGSACPELPLSDVNLLAPIPKPIRNIFCVGKNYYAHALEFHGSGFDSNKEDVPSNPIIFSKATTSVCGPGDDVLGSLDPTQSVDYEGELGVVIGREAFQVSKAEAMDYVFGYMNINDVTSRELQKKHNQWLIGKGLNTFCPMGPWILTADEVGDVGDLKLQTTVNGELRQDASVSDLIFDIPTLIETLSQTMTLLPGDIIATGTPVGVGIGFSPPKYLASGDTVTVSITGLGELTNQIR
jgi:2-keto-4-pentenoate hydratase/2-oxohepta-3-ene-1,7-dioic acid hydratase in catechol pathway